MPAGKISAVAVAEVCAAGPLRPVEYPRFPVIEASPPTVFGPGLHLPLSSFCAGVSTMPIRAVKLLYVVTLALATWPLPAVL